MVLHSHFFKNFPQLWSTVKGFHVIVNEAQVDVFLECSCFFCYPTDVGNLVSDSSAFSKSILYIWNFLVETPCQQGQGSRGPGTGASVRTGWKPLALGKWPTASELPSCLKPCHPGTIGELPSRLKPCHPGTVGGMRDSHHGPHRAGSSCKWVYELSHHLWLLRLQCGQGASWWELIANYYLEESGYFIFLLCSVPHSLLSPMFSFLDIYLKGKNNILMYRGFGVSSPDVAVK